MNHPMYQRAAWISSTNIYEVNIRQYTEEGTFNGFARSLPRLKDMGVDVLWFMPIYPIGQQNRKGSLGSYYSIADFTSVNPEFGTAADFKKLVGEIHAMGMRVILDWVANHAAWDHVWTRDNPDYFVRNAAGDFLSPYDWTDVIQIDHTNENQQKAMIEAMAFWVTEYDVDGFRADLAHLTPLAFWKKARTAIEPLKTGLFWLAESEEVNYHEVFDASFTWEWMHQTAHFYKGHADLNSLYQVLARYQTEFPETAHRMYFTSNHDENSWNGTADEKYGDMLKALIVFSNTWNGIPLIYSGEELPNKKRLQFFEKDAIAWDGECRYHQFYKTLLQLRKTNAALRSADSSVTTFHILTSGNKNIMAYLRKAEDDEVFVVLNLSVEPATFSIHDRLIAGAYTDVFTGITNRLEPGCIIQMEPWQYLVFEKKQV